MIRSVEKPHERIRAVAGAGEWLMSLEDFKKLNSPADIKNSLALPSEPTHFNVAQIPEGTVIRESQAAKVWARRSILGQRRNQTISNTKFLFLG